MLCFQPLACPAVIGVLAPSMFTYLFSCCFRPRRRDPTIPDERTYLIPATTPSETPTPHPRVVDHQKLKERLGTVIRSKEGKMVNVNLAFPFNLHHQSLGDPPSRSVSGGTLDSYQRSRRNSRSDPSLHGDREGSTSRSNDPLDRRGDHQKPILNVRLVPTPVCNSTSTSRAVNGISRGRPGRGVEYRRHAVVDVSHPDEHQDNADEENDAQPRLEVVTLSVEGADESTDTSSHDVMAPPIDDFTIRDAGAVSCSWGD